MIDWLRALCLSLPHTTEEVQWVTQLLFKVGGKMFATIALEGEHGLAFKCSAEEFEELVERPGIIPAPYLARAKWVALEHEGAMPRAELKQRITRSYDLVKGGLPKKTQAELGKKKR